MNPDQNTQTPPANSPFQEAPKHGGGNVALVGGIVLLIIVLLLGWYLVQEKQTTNEEIPTPQPLTQEVPAGTPETDAAATALSEQGTSDEMSDIEADVEATNTSSLEEVNEI